LLGSCRGTGCFFTARHVRTNLSVTIKLIDLDKDKRKKTWDLVIDEILVMRKSCHANIVKFIDSFLYKNEIWIVMEFVEGASLTGVITAIFSSMTEGQIAAVSRETAQGLRYLHEQGVIHRNVKSDNVLLSLTGDIKLSSYRELLS
jgi:p21-activated kinase 1